VAPPWLNGALAGINGALAGINASMQAINASILAINVQLMRALNKPVTNPGDDLTPLAGVVVQHFPATLQDLRLFTNNRAMAIIAAYGIGGKFNNIAARRAAIAAYIGVTRYNVVGVV